MFFFYLDDGSQVFYYMIDSAVVELLTTKTDRTISGRTTISEYFI